MTLDFTLEKYTELCNAIQRNYSTCTFYDFLINFKKINEDINCLENISYYTVHRKIDARICIIRHDVDRKIKNSLIMAEIEHDLGIRSSYYFRHPYTFKPDIISKIHELGHEVGYHYETLSKARGEPKVAIKLFEEELNEFKKIHEIKTICMHGKPLSGYDNRELWKYYDFHDYGIEGEAYLSIDEQKIQYFTDTGRNWSNKNSLRDFMSVPQTYSVETTDDLINLIKSAEESYLYLNIHPERWTKNYFNWISSYLQDNLINAGKTIIAAIQQ